MLGHELCLPGLRLVWQQSKVAVHARCYMVHVTHTRRLMFYRLIHRLNLLNLRLDGCWRPLQPQTIRTKTKRSSPLAAGSWPVSKLRLQHSGSWPVMSSCKMTLLCCMLHVMESCAMPDHEGIALGKYAIHSADYNSKHLLVLVPCFFKDQMCLTPGCKCRSASYACSTVAAGMQCLPARRRSHAVRSEKLCHAKS